jgi:hypothetical protein
VAPGSKSDAQVGFCAPHSHISGPNCTVARATAFVNRQHPLFAFSAPAKITLISLTYRNGKRISTHNSGVRDDLCEIKSATKSAAPPASSALGFAKLKKQFSLSKACTNMMRGGSVSSKYYTRSFPFLLSNYIFHVHIHSFCEIKSDDEKACLQRKIHTIRQGRKAKIA